MAISVYISKLNALIIVIRHNEWDLNQSWKSATKLCWQLWPPRHPTGRDNTSKETVPEKCFRISSLGLSFSTNGPVSSTEVNINGISCCRLCNNRQNCCLSGGISPDVLDFCNISEPCTGIINTNQITVQCLLTMMPKHTSQHVFRSVISILNLFNWCALLLFTKYHTGYKL